MKLLIASDIHGSAYYCRALLAAWDREQPDRALLLGDILYHGPRNDLPRDYAPKEVSALLNERRERILCVRGNCEAEVDQMMLSFPALADYAWVYADGVSMFATHGHIYNTGNLPPLCKGDILLHGHTHLPAWETHEAYRYFNPGSVSIPKGQTEHSYMILENGRFIWKTLSGDIYHQERA
ncbi:MAG: phosphodiesterase [Clostridia bacterium]|nr:phosphodiesterase [Clostridia bacterium]